jgi:hypothetical protein
MQYIALAGVLVFVAVHVSFAGTSTGEERSSKSAANIRLAQNSACIKKCTASGQSSQTCTRLCSGQRK